MPSTPHQLTTMAHAVDAHERRLHYGHAGAVIWLTGLSGSGKSSLAMGLEQALMRLGYSCYVLDGDNVRSGLNSDLGFGDADRSENIRRIGEVAALFADAGLVCITAFISPFLADRALARARCKQGFHEIHVAADLAACEARDPKGLYKKARAGQLPSFTGIGSPYEPPVHPECMISTGTEALSESLATLLDYVRHAVPLAR